MTFTKEQYQEYYQRIKDERNQKRREKYLAQKVQVDELKKCQPKNEVDEINFWHKVDEKDKIVRPEKEVGENVTPEDANTRSENFILVTPEPYGKGVESVESELDEPIFFCLECLNNPTKKMVAFLSRHKWYSLNNSWPVFHCVPPSQL